MARPERVLLGAALLLAGWAAPALSAGGFNQASLDRLLSRNPRTGKPVETVEELIPLLPEELRQNFTFVYDSRSPFRESISPDFPRVILFTKDGKFLLTFTGDPAKNGYGLLETMQFDQGSARFRLRAKALPAAKARGGAAPVSRTCLRCHGQDPRPIFDSYPLWPGFYGSAEDSFPPGIAAAREEEARYRHFLSAQARRGVYKDLLYVQGSPVSPYYDPKLLRPEAQEADPTTLYFMPNERLGIALTELNRQRIFRKLRGSATFRRREAELLRELLDCGPSAVEPEAADRILAELKEENAARLVRLGVDPAAPGAGLNDMQELKHPFNMAQIDWLARQAGVDRGDWSMALEPHSLSFFDGVLSGMHEGHSFYLKEDLIYEILRHEAATDRRFHSFYSPYSPFAGLGYEFGRRVQLGAARQSCSFLAQLLNKTGPASPRNPEVNR